MRAIDGCLRIAGDGALEVTGNAASVSFTRSDDGAEVTVLLIGPPSEDGSSEKKGGVGDDDDAFDSEASKLHGWSWRVAAQTPHKL